IESHTATSQEELQQRRRTSPGLTERDVRILQANVQSLEVLSARRTLHPSQVLPKSSRQVPELYGVRSSYAVIHALQAVEGDFFPSPDDEASSAVCVLGQTAKVNLLGYDPGLGKFVKVNDTWLQVVGVLSEPSDIVYIPLNTFQYRFWDRSSFMKDDLDGVDLRLKVGADSVQVAKIVTAIL